MSDRPPPPPPKDPMKRSWRSKFLEVLLWTAVAVATAVVMVLLSEELLPANF